MRKRNKIINTPVLITLAVFVVSTVISLVSPLSVQAFTRANGENNNEPEEPIKELSLRASKFRSYKALEACVKSFERINKDAQKSPIDNTRFTYAGNTYSASYYKYGSSGDRAECTLSNMQSKINEMDKGMVKEAKGNKEEKLNLKAMLQKKVKRALDEDGKEKCPSSDKSVSCYNNMSVSDLISVLNKVLDTYKYSGGSNMSGAAHYMLWADAFKHCTKSDPRKPESFKSKTSDNTKVYTIKPGGVLESEDTGKLKKVSAAYITKLDDRPKDEKFYIPYALYSDHSCEKNVGTTGSYVEGTQSTHYTYVAGCVGDGSFFKNDKPGQTDCNKMASKVSEYFPAYIENWNKYKDKNPDFKPDFTELPGGTESGKDDEDDKCTSSFKGFGWLMCPGQTLIMDAVDGFYKWIANSLKWTVLADNEYDGKSVHDIWRSFLDIANIVFAIIFLVMIYSMATSTGLSNYDIKKILPRLVVVVVAVNLSFYICAALVDISNIVGSSVYDMIFGMAKDSADWTGADAWLNGLTSIVLGVIAIFIFGGAAIVALAIIIACIVFRQIALVVLIVISPIAFALYMLPNTQKWYKKWFNLFTKLLIVYPMFTAMWGASRLIANIFATGTVDEGIPGFIINFACAIAPAVAVIPLFKATGGLMATVAGYTAGKMNASGIGKKVNKAGRNMVKNNPATRAVTRGISNTAGKFGANNANAQYNNALANATLGTAQRFAGRKALGLSNAAGGHANSIQTQLQTIDNAAMDAANTQLSTLDNNALKAIITTGTYNGKQADQYTLRTAMNLAGDKMDADEVSDMLTAMNTRIAAARNKGNVSEANNLQKATIAAANASGNYLGKASALSNIGSYSNNDTNWYNNSIADKIAGSSSNSIAGMSGASLGRVNQAIKATNDAKAKDGAISAMRKAEQDIQNNPELQSKLSAKAASNINDIAKQSRKITAGSSDADVSRHHINDLRQAYNSGDANLRATAIERGNEIINNPELLNKTTGLTTNEQNILQEIAIGEITNV